MKNANPMPEFAPQGPFDKQTRVDALAKAVGRERYSADFTPEGCLWAGAKRALVPRARIVAVHVDEARRTPGVTAVLTAADVPGTGMQGVVHKDQPVLARDLARHAGDPLALVVAESREALQAGLAAIRLDLDPLPGVLDPEAALAPDSPLVHPGREGGNLLAEALLEKGNACSALAECAVVVEGVYHTPMQDHAFLEPVNATARLTRSGGVEMSASTQAPFRDRFEVAQALGLSPWKIRVKAPYLGGAFGGKDGATAQCLAALAALVSGGRWVKTVWSREEVFLAGYKRHGARVRLRLGADRDGTLRALDCDMLFDSGPYAHLSAEIMALGMEHAAGPYRIPHTKIHGRCAYTNNPIGGAFRGFGVLQACFAIERAMDALARKLGQDPAELRLRNALSAGDENGVGVAVEGEPGARACLKLLVDHPFWKNRQAWKNAAPPLTRRGVGLTASLNAMGYGRGLADASACKLEFTPRGDFAIYSGVPDMGQGNASAFAMMAAKALNQPIESIGLVQPDTARCLPSGSSSASRTTYTFGNALLGACEAMAEKLRVRAAQALLVDDPDRLELVPGAVEEPATGKRLPLSVIAAALPRDDRICVDQFVMPVAQTPPGMEKAFFLGFPHRFYSYGACLCAAEVDELTGQVRLDRVATAVECGRVLYVQGVEQQMHGATAQGAGMTLMEDPALDHGLMRAANFSTYLIPTALDLPDMDCRIARGDEPTGPLGLRGMGEVGVHGPGPATAQAVEDAVGLSVDRLPVDPEAVLAALGEGAP